jgi:hypothetical protein
MSLHLIQTLKQYQHNGIRWHHIFSQTPKRKGQCRVIFCKRLARVQVRRKAGKLCVATHSTCITCESRLWRANHPARSVYREIKNRAKRRGQIFDITFEQFCATPRFEEYLTHRGTGIGELHLDRKKVHRGYVPGNLQVITTAENLRKQREVDYCTGPF